METGQPFVRCAPLLAVHEDAPLLPAAGADGWAGGLPELPGPAADGGRREVEWLEQWSCLEPRRHRERERARRDLVAELGPLPPAERRTRGAAWVRSRVDPPIREAVLRLPGVGC